MPQSREISRMMSIASFRALYAPRLSASSVNSRQAIAVNAGLLGKAPASGVLTGRPPGGTKDASTNRYLWVIDSSGIPYILEVSLIILHNELPKHTNLTAGGRAYIGGELWFHDYVSIYVSGGSGRYPPENPQQLANAVEVFRSYGYKVTSLGWDYDNDEAARYIKS